MLRLRRKSISRQNQLQAAKRVASHANRWLRRGTRIGCYWAEGSELSLTPLIQKALHRDVEIYFPIIPIRGRRMWFSRLDDQSFWYKEKRFGMWETSGFLKRAEQLDLLFVPLLGIDFNGFRLGQGGGFYDQTLSFRRFHPAINTKLIGIAFECQRLDNIPKEAWDMPLDALITESGVTFFSRLGAKQG